MSNQKKVMTVEQAPVEPAKKKGLGDYIMWGWVILLILAGILMAYKFIYG